MTRGSAGFVSIIVLVLLAFIALKVLGAVIGFALKAALLVALAGVAVVAYLAVQKRIGGPGAP